jgi:formylglycine-generating enzyme
VPRCTTTSQCVGAGLCCQPLTDPDAAAFNGAGACLATSEDSHGQCLCKVTSECASGTCTPAGGYSTCQEGNDSGSDSGGDSSSGSSSGGNGVVCTPDAMGCSGAQPQVCNSQGTGWQNQGPACSAPTPACLSGVCVCSTGALDCDGQQPRTCGTNGQWQNVGPACSGSTPVCLAGACVTCSPGANQCSGSGVDICTSTGQWGSPWACATGVCSGGACTGSTTAGASCSAGGPGMTNCGASDSCCTSLEVAGGTYDRSYVNSGGGPTGEANPATVSGFRLDKYLVTVGRFRQFVNAVLPDDGGAGWTPPAGSGKHAHLNSGQGLANSASAGTYETGWVTSDDGNISPTDGHLACIPPYDTWTASASTQENLPINCVTWQEAYAFCIWDGGFLPSEAEWEYAAAGGSQQLEYPWGSTAPGTANLYAIYGPGNGDCYYPSGSETCSGVSNVAPVGTTTLGAAVWGQLDMAGDLFEWNLDWHATYVTPCTDCAYLMATSYRAFRGGCFNVTASYFLPPYRYPSAPTPRGNNMGFRCARTP